MLPGKVLKWKYIKESRRNNLGSLSKGYFVEWKDIEMAPSTGVQFWWENLDNLNKIFITYC